MSSRILKDLLQNTTEEVATILGRHWARDLASNMLLMGDALETLVKQIQEIHPTAKEIVLREINTVLLGEIKKLAGDKVVHVAILQLMLNQALLLRQDKINA